MINSQEHHVHYVVETFHRNVFWKGGGELSRGVLSGSLTGQLMPQLIPHIPA